MERSRLLRAPRRELARQLPSVWQRRATKSTAPAGEVVGSGRASAKECGAQPVDMSTLYTFRSKGYADYPVLSSRKTVGTQSALDVR